MSSTKISLPMLMRSGKLQLPIVDNKDMKCSPDKPFENGSCYPLEVLIKMADAYNQYCKDNELDTNISLDDKLESLYPDQYKIYLVNEFANRFKGSQHDWIKNKFATYMDGEEKEDIENNTFRPTGPQGKFEWLSTFDINKTLEQYENKYPDFKFLGAVPIDFNELNEYPFKNMNFDEFKNSGKKRIGVIFNLDRHDQSGSHWVSLFSDLENGQIYFSDSYGTKPHKNITDFMKRIHDYLTNNKKISNIDYRFNRTQHQTGGSECGVYSINFILRLLKGKMFDHITSKRLTDKQVNKCRAKYFNNVEI